jgi:hypothetical protein
VREPRPASNEMDQVACTCSTCGTRIGVFFNRWARVGKGYLSPLVDEGKNLAVLAQGPVRSGEPLTLVHGWYVHLECSWTCSRTFLTDCMGRPRSHLQDIACSECDAVLGLRCNDVPVNHVLDRSVDIASRTLSTSRVSSHVMPATEANSCCE